MIDPPAEPLEFPVQTSALHPEPGATVVVDHIDGRAPAYIFLHGFGAGRDGIKSRALFRHAQSRGHAAVRFDFRGHGDSSGQPNGVTIRELIADAKAVLDFSGESILVGSSLGGLISTFTAAANPEQIVGLALLAPALGFVPDLASHLDAEGYLPSRARPPDPMQQRVIDDAKSLDDWAAVSQLSMPVFIAHGHLDDIVPTSQSERLFEAIPHNDKELWLIPDGDHRLCEPIDPILERMEKLFAAVRE